MLLFIGNLYHSYLQLFYFKTSHVIVYPIRKTYFHWTCYISKHLMLLFIFVKYSADRTENKFQNISCYCLSIAVYFFGTGFPVFQNISCYCLSKCTNNFCTGFVDFKTSHVIVYPKQPDSRTDTTKISKHLMLLFITIRMSINVRYWNFKTSHVIVYQL